MKKQEQPVCLGQVWADGYARGYKRQGTVIEELHKDGREAVRLHITSNYAGLPDDRKTVVTLVNLRRTWKLVEGQ
jgi:hypothetical protein